VSPKTSALRRERPVALVVDVDGTLLRVDLLWEGLVELAVRRPLRLPVVVLTFLLCVFLAA
jgi:hypothetical protein